MVWNKLLCSKKYLQLVGTLNGGQSFRWQKVTNETEGSPEECWIGVFRNRVWLLTQDDSNILYKVFEKNGFSDDSCVYDKLLVEYFQLNIDIENYYKEWSEKDVIFKKAATQFYGIRMLAQDPVENLFSFICSQNNHISRISSLVEKLCSMYGEKITTFNGKTYHAFPQVEKLAESKVEDELRKASFGYRARYIHESAKQILEFGGTEWFDKLKQMDYKSAKTELCKLTGIGAKVADCICLMSLGHLDAIPVDTHVLQIAQTHYLPHLMSKKKGVSNRVYEEIGDFFRNLFGPLAGWAHTVLFCADLKKFQSPQKTQCEDEIKVSNKKRKTSKT